MSENKTKMTILRFIGIWFLPIIFGWKVIKKESGYAGMWRTWTYIWIGLFAFAVIGGVVKGRRNKGSVSTSYIYALPNQIQLS